MGGGRHGISCRVETWIIYPAHKNFCIKMSNISKRQIANERRLALIKSRKAKLDAEKPPEVTLTVTHPAASIIDPETTTMEAVIAEIASLPVPSALDALYVHTAHPTQDTPTECAEGPNGVVLCRIYGRPANRCMRLIEFKDGSHGRAWVNMNAAPMVGWVVWVKPSANVPGDWELHGRYNSRGTRML